MKENIKNAFAHRVSRRLPRGEFWIGTNIFAERKIEDDIKAHVVFCLEMGMDFVSIPVGHSESDRLGYRIFNPLEIRNANESSLFVVAVVSGPLQRIVDEKGLELVLADIAGNTVGIRKAIEHEAETVSSLVEAGTDNGANAVMIAEDVASDAGSFFAPKMFHAFFQPLYRGFVDDMHRRRALAIFHSCGNITNLMPDIVSSGFDGLSCQMECLDILSLKRTYGDQITLFSGVSREFLDNDSLSIDQMQQFGQVLKAIAANGDFVLSSSSGLSSPNMVSNLRRLYCCADEIWNQAKKVDVQQSSE
jgi:hypothetical protein